MKTLNTLAALLLAPATVGLLTLPGCSTAPPSQEAKQDLSQESHLALDEMRRADPNLQNFLDTHAYAYAIFPNIGKGAVGVGAAYGRGEVYEQNKFIGYADVSQGSVGLALGGQSFAELIVFENKNALNQLEDNKMSFTANAGAVAMKTGASTGATFANGVVIFTQPRGGLMFDVSVGGQQFTFKSAETENQ